MRGKQHIAIAYLVLVRRPHVLHNLLTLGLGHPTSLGNDLRQNSVDLTSHVCCITTNVEIGFLGKQVADLLGSLLESVLHINLLGALSRKGGDQLEFVTESLLVFLELVSKRFNTFGPGYS